MTSWKQAFLDRIYLDAFPESSFTFGGPVSSQELAELEDLTSVGIPQDLRELLGEFNGVTRTDRDYKEPVLFSTIEMVEAIQIYRDWPDVPTDHLIEWSRNILYLTQHNGFACMAGLVVHDLGSFTPGEFVCFDHDYIYGATKPGDLFRRCADDLAGLIEYATTGYC